MAASGRPGREKMTGDPNRCYCNSLLLPYYHRLSDHRGKASK